MEQRLDELLVERGLAETRSKAQALVLAGKVRVGEGDAARRDPSQATASADGRRRSRSTSPSRTSDAGATSSPRRSTPSAIDPAGTDGARCRRLDRRLHGRPVAARRAPCLRSRRGSRSTRRVVATRLACHLDGAHERPHADRRRRSRDDRPRRHRRLVHLARQGARPGRHDTLAPAADIVALVKPQFEAGKGRTDHGVVRDPAIHREVLERVTAHARVARPRHPRRHRVADHRARTAIASSSSTWRTDPAARTSPSASPRSPARDGPTDRLRVQPDDRGHRRAGGARIGLVPSAWDRRMARAVRRPRDPASRAADDRCPRRARWRWHVPAGGARRRGGRRPAARHQPGQGRVPLEGRGRRPRSGPRAHHRRRVPPRRADGDRGPDHLAAAGTAIGDRHIALNDIVIARGSLARVCRLDVSIDDSHLATFIADGLVVASPTGSTGYSFSAGGPILDPASRNLVVTPIAAYLSAIRSVVVSPEQVVRCRVVDALRGARLGRRPRGPADRRRRYRRGPGARRPIRLIEPKGAQPFWDLLRHKVELLPS